jgi:hypothetical protein
VQEARLERASEPTRYRHSHHLCSVTPFVESDRASLHARARRIGDRCAGRILVSRSVGTATRRFSKAGFRGGHPAKRGSELCFLPVDQGIAVERADLSKWCTHAPTRGSQRARDRMNVAWLDHVRYERQATPSLPFSAVEAVRPRRTVLLRLGHSACESSPLA